MASRPIDLSDKPFRGLQPLTHDLAVVMRAQPLPPVIAGLDPAIHEAVPPAGHYCFACCHTSWMRGSSPRMTLGGTGTRQWQCVGLCHAVLWSSPAGA